MKKQNEHPEGQYASRKLREYRQFHLLFPDFEIWHSRVPNLTWTHIRQVLPVQNENARYWYLGEAEREGWSARTLSRTFQEELAREIERQTVNPTNRAMRLPLCKKQHGVTLASNPQTGIENMESGTGNQESGPEPTENGTVNSESGPEPTENGTVIQESGPEPTENGTVNQESGPEPTENGTVNQESGPEPTENGTVSQERGTEDRIEAQNRRILQLLHDQPEASIVEMRRRIGLSERTIKRRLAELKQQGRLRRIGSDRKGHWEVMEH
ncbi:MAG: DUF1016 N-terminal domain-containing protein [Oligosphaeraceae bacterium]